MKFFLFCSLFGIAALSKNVAVGVSMWELGTVPFGLGCTKIGLTGIPGLEDLGWLLNTHCMTYNGTVGCMPVEGMAPGTGTCRCTQPNETYYDALTQRCLGRVGAFCSAEHSTIFPDKQCTPHADCVPIQGVGHSVGKCECLYGYKKGPLGGCEIDDSVSEGDRSTPRPTTTTQAPAREEFKLPPITLLKYVGYSKSCQPGGLLNRTVCETHSRTVSCIEESVVREEEIKLKTCKCNMEEDAVYDEELDMCVGKAETYCLARGNILGYKACVENANCETEDEFEKGYSFGKCKCAYGYKNVDGLCERDTSISNPSSAGTIVPPTTTTKTTTETLGDRSSGTSGVFAAYLIITLITVSGITCNYM